MNPISFQEITVPVPSGAVPSSTDKKARADALKKMKAAAAKAELTPEQAAFKLAITRHGQTVNFRTVMDPQRFDKETGAYKPANVYYSMDPATPFMETVAFLGQEAAADCLNKAVARMYRALSDETSDTVSLADGKVTKALNEGRFFDRLTHDNLASLASQKMTDLKTKEAGLLEELNNFSKLIGTIAPVDAMKALADVNTIALKLQEVRAAMSVRKSKGSKKAEQLGSVAAA